MNLKERMPFPSDWPSETILIRAKLCPPEGAFANTVTTMVCKTRVPPQFGSPVWSKLAAWRCWTYMHSSILLHVSCEYLFLFLKTSALFYGIFFQTVLFFVYCRCRPVMGEDFPWQLIDACGDVAMSWLVVELFVLREVYRTGCLVTAACCCDHVSRM